MRRREFMGLFGATALVFPRSGYAQIKADLPVVAFIIGAKLDTTRAKDRITELRTGLHEGGLIEGTNYTLAVRSSEGNFSRVSQLLPELGSLNPRVFVVIGMGIDLTRGSFPETPLVFTAVAADPIALGWAQSYVQPGGMITGNVMNAVGGEHTMTQKRIGLFKQLVPELTRLGMIASYNGAVTMKEKDALQKVADELGFELLHYNLGTIDDLEAAFATGLRDDVSAFFISGEPMLGANLPRVMASVAASRKPSVGSHPDWGRSGLLMSYATDIPDGVVKAGVYAAKILKGAKPGDLPIEQASKFTLVINQRTAKALGIVVPPALLALADEVIE